MPNLPITNLPWLCQNCGKATNEPYRDECKLCHVPRAAQTRSTTLIGETKDRPGTDLTRVPINIDRAVREELNILLYQPYMRGVGYSEFLRRAIKRAYEEADEQGVG